MKRSEYMELQKRAAALVQKIFLFIRPEQIEIAGFGMDDDFHLLALINLFNETFCGKLLISLPGWICPAHYHLSPKGQKDEGFYVVYGTLVVAEPDDIQHEVQAGETLYLPAGTIHQLSTLGEGVVFFEFSQRDERIDVFPLDQVTRDPEIVEDVPGFQPPEKGFQILGDIGTRLTPHVGLSVTKVAGTD